MAELRHYAELLDGRVRLKAWYDPERLPPGGELIDITDIKPEPEVWALYVPAVDVKAAPTFTSVKDAPFPETAKQKALSLVKTIDGAKLAATEEGKALKALLVAILEIDL